MMNMQVEFVAENELVERWKIATGTCKEENYQ
jgi:hypothetical protein